MVLPADTKGEFGDDLIKIHNISQYITSLNPPPPVHVPMKKNVKKDVKDKAKNIL